MWNFCPCTLSRKLWSHFIQSLWGTFWRAHESAIWLSWSDISIWAQKYQQVLFTHQHVSVVQLDTLETILHCYPGSVIQHADTQIWTLEGKQRSMCYWKAWANPEDVSLKTWAGIWICVLTRTIRKIQLSPSSQIRKIDNPRTQYLIFLKKAWLCHHHFWSSIQSPEIPMCTWRIWLRI